MMINDLIRDELHRSLKEKGARIQTTVIPPPEDWQPPREIMDRVTWQASASKTPILKPVRK